MVFVGISKTLRVSCVSLIVFLYLGNFLLPHGTIWYVPVLISYFLVPLFTTWYLLGTYSVPTRYLLGTSRYPSVISFPFVAIHFLNHPVDLGVKVKKLI